MTPGLFLIGLLVLPLLIGAPAGAGATVEGDLRRTVETLSSAPSRMSGYPGLVQAREWLVAELQGMGLDEIYRHEFPVLVPVDQGFSLESGAESLPLYGVWPNLVRTPTLPPAGIEAKMVYGGDGRLFATKQVADRIALLDYNSGSAWIEAFDLGARAVILLESAGTHRQEAAEKFLSVPANLPRFYASASVAARLRVLAEEGASVRVRGRMIWRETREENIVAIVRGSDPNLRAEAVILAAHYDAVSPVPALAPGAAEAASAAALLHLARFFAELRPARTIVLMWTAGHFQNLAGMRHFVPLMLRASGRRPEGVVPDSEFLRCLRGLDVRLFAGLDLSSQSEVLGVFRPRVPYRTSLLTPPITTRLMQWVRAYEDSVFGGARMMANGLKPDFSRQGLGDLAQAIPLDAAVAALAGCPALAFATVNDSRAIFDTPVDRSAAMDFERLARQVELLDHVLPKLVDDPQLAEWEWGNDAFGTVRGEVVHYGPRSYLPDQPTAGALVRLRLRQPTLSGVRPDFWAAADDSGRFVVPGVESGLIYTQPVRLEAYRLDGETGVVTDAPDWGINGERKLPGRSLTILMDEAEEEVQIVTAPLRGTTLFGLCDPRNLLTPERLQVVDARTEAEPALYGACLPLTTAETERFGYENRIGSRIAPVGVLFAKANSRFKGVMATGRYGLGRRLVLLNGSVEAPQGEGYRVSGEGRLIETAYRIAQDLYWLNDLRVGELRRHGVRNTRLVSFHDRSAQLLQEADAARAELRHRDFFDRARRAWALAAAAYRDVERTQAGVVQGVVFLLVLLIPFAHFAERLLFGFADLRRQVLGYFVLFLIGFIALRYLHPAFELSISPAMILLGFVILALGILVTTLGMARLNRELQELGRKRRGRMSIRRGGTALRSVAVGLAHLRRRPWRTGLTCTTLVLLTFSLLSFTSIRTSLRTNRVEIGAGAAYDGVVVRMPGWQTMEFTGYRILRDWFGAERVAPRAWKGVKSLSASFRIERDDVQGVAVGVWGFTGLTPEEGLLTGPQQGLVAGRWLRAGEEDVCLLPVGLADSLGIGAEVLDGARVRIFGEIFRVVGLLEDDALDRPDLSGEPLTPLDPEAQQPPEQEAVGGRGGQVLPFTHLPGASVVVLPFAGLMRWEGAYLSSVAVGFAEGGITADQALQDLSETLDLNLFVGLGGMRFLVNTVGVASVTGLGELAVPLAIAALIVFNTMLGAVYERTREIGTFNAVGLAPGHVSGLFIAEAVALGVIGVVSGYLLGQAAVRLLDHWGWLQGLEFNYSSLSSVLTIGLIGFLVVASALYPAQMAGRICTPGIERRWKLPPGTGGDRIAIRLPFSLVRHEALGMAAFQAEFWAENQEQSIGAGFYVEALGVERAGDILRIEARVWLAPFDQGVIQQTVLKIGPGSDSHYCDIDAELELVAGDRVTWHRVVRTFLDDLRKQFLIWRTLEEEDRQYYAEQLPRWVRTRNKGQA